VESVFAPYGDARQREYPFTLLGAEEHDPSLGHPEWVGQPVSHLKGRCFRQIHSPQEIQQHLLYCFLTSALPRKG
jgi:hypothetical protein